MERPKLRPYFFSLVLVAAVTMLGEIIKRYLEPTNLVMLYLLIVMVVAMRWGRGPAIATSVLGVLAFDFFLVPPYLTFAVSQIQYLFTFVGLLTVGVVVSELMSRSREQSEKTRQLELLRATEKLQTALLNSISHDLRTPLSSIIGSVSMLLQDAPSLGEETVRELLQDAYGESNRLNRIVGNLLDMARMEAGALKISPKPCELRDILGVSLQELKPKLGNRKLDIQIPRDLPEIAVDFPWIVKVLVNLIDNALKYSDDGAPVRIRAKMNGWQVKIEIEDEGSGILAEDVKRIFDKFYRVSKPKQVSGLGLGLSICRGIVEAHHGQIGAENRPGKKGAVFTVLLPLALGSP
ncbi:MAG: DUF4118 domain-containing protein [Candidatus Omnitrophota bacterium]